MTVPPLYVLSTGLVSSIGLTATASCAAMRAKLSNPVQTRFIDSAGEWIMGHEVPLEKPWRGRARLARMAMMAIEEAMAGIPKTEWGDVPLYLCVAEQGRPGRTEGLEDRLFADIEHALGVRFASPSVIVPHGRVAAAVALMQARDLIQRAHTPRALIVAADSLLDWATLGHYERGDRLLTPRNSNGFMPGEGAGALLIGPPENGAVVACCGLGFATEPAPIDAGQPLRADGLSHAINVALAEAGSEMHEMELRIADLAGEHYYFKEAAVAVSRTLRRRKEKFDLWHPAECTGELGAVAGISVIALADGAIRQGLIHDTRIVAHMANDSGSRAAMILQCGSA